MTDDKRMPVKEVIQFIEDTYENVQARKQEMFYDKYPKLFPIRKIPEKKAYSSDKILPAYTTQEPECGFTCGVGWWPLIDKLCADLSEMIEDNAEGKESFRVSQIKEKFGGLRCYVDWNFEDGFEIPDDFRKAVQDRISKAESDSFSICEVCGKPGSTEGSRSWIKVFCPEHRAQDDAERAERFKSYPHKVLKELSQDPENYEANIEALSANIRAELTKK